MKVTSVNRLRAVAGLVIDSTEAHDHVAAVPNLAPVFKVQLHLHCYSLLTVQPVVSSRVAVLLEIQFVVLKFII